LKPSSMRVREYIISHILSVKESRKAPLLDAVLVSLAREPSIASRKPVVKIVASRIMVFYTE